MPVHPNACRKQYFKYGDIPFGSQHNNLIYGTSLYQNLHKEAPKNKVQEEENYFVYGTDKNTIPSSEKNRFKKPTGYPAEMKTSKEIMIKAQQAKEARDDYAKFLERKQNRLIEKEEEKRKDFDLLKSYAAPWLRHEGATKTAGTTRKTYKGPGDDFGPTSAATQSYIKFGEPGCGAPLRSSSGSLKAALKIDPEMRFQKRDRHQIHDIIEPLKREQNVVARTSVNILGQEMKNSYGGERQFESYEPRDILGQTKTNWKGNGDDENSRKSTDMENSYDNDVCRYNNRSSSQHVAKSLEGSAVNNYHIDKKEKDNYYIQVPGQDKDGKELEGKLMHRNNDKIMNKFSDQFNPWGKSGNGAPNCDSRGNLVAHYQGKWKEDLIGTFTKTKDEKEEDRKYLENITTQNPPESISEPTVNNGNYYRMHLDAQKNNEAVDSVDQNDVKSFVSDVLNNAMENPHPRRAPKSKRTTGERGESRVIKVNHSDKDRNTNNTQKQSFEKRGRNAEWKNKKNKNFENEAGVKKRLNDPQDFSPHDRDVPGFKEGDASAYSLNPNIIGDVSGFREMETYIPSAQENIFGNNKQMNDSPDRNQQSDTKKRPSGSKKNLNGIIPEKSHGEGDRVSHNERQESRNITHESSRKSNESESSEDNKSGIYSSFGQLSNQNDKLLEVTVGPPTNPDDQDENQKKTPTLSLSLQRKIKTRRESIVP